MEKKKARATGPIVETLLEQVDTLEQMNKAVDRGTGLGPERFVELHTPLTAIRVEVAKLQEMQKQTALLRDLLEWHQNIGQSLEYVANRK